MNELMRWLLFLPPQASSVALGVDRLHYLVILTTMGGATLVAVVAAWFLFRYRHTRRANAPASDRAITPPGWLEAAMIVGLFGVFITFWWLGSREFMVLRVAPENSMDVYVTAKQWMWKFAYPEGAHSIARLYVPVGRPIRLVMTSRDVIHSFYVPDFRIKQDAVPGRYTTAWFKVMKPGTYEILCAEYCGTDHSTMRGEVVALPAEEYARWVKGAPAAGKALAEGFVPPAVMIANGVPEELDMVKQGEISASRHGCQKCHTTDGTPHIGPTWVGLYMSNITLGDGSTVVADGAYLTESMMDPRAKLHAGFADIMPSYMGQLQPAEVGAIVEFIRALQHEPAPKAVDEPSRPVSPQNAPERKGQTFTIPLQNGDSLGTRSVEPGSVAPPLEGRP